MISIANLCLCGHYVFLICHRRRQSEGEKKYESAIKLSSAFFYYIFWYAHERMKARNEWMKKGKRKSQGEWVREEGKKH